MENLAVDFSPSPHIGGKLIICFSDSASRARKTRRLQPAGIFPTTFAREAADGKVFNCHALVDRPLM